MKKIMIVVVLSMWSAGLWCMDEDKNTLNFPPLVSLFGKKSTPEFPEIDNILNVEPEQNLSKRSHPSKVRKKNYNSIRKNKKNENKENYDTFLNHYRQCQKFKSEPISIRCNICQKIYESEYGIQVHMKDDHGETMSRGKNHTVEKSLHCGVSDCTVKPVRTVILINHQIAMGHCVCYYCKQHIL